MKYDVVIIGSGFGGLTCAHLLAKAGRKVLVLEAHWQPGGCMQSYQRKGHSFDTGLHYVGGLGDGETLHDIFEQTRLSSKVRPTAWRRASTISWKCWPTASPNSALPYRSMWRCYRDRTLTLLSMHGHG